MYAPWVTSSAALLREGQPAEFVPDGKEVAMDGTYVQRTFRSRWACYEVKRVKLWRSADWSNEVRELAQHAAD